MARLKPEFIPIEQVSEETIGAIVAVGQRQAQLVNELELALLANDVARVCELARAICSLEKNVEGSAKR